MLVKTLVNARSSTHTKVDCVLTWRADDNIATHARSFKHGVMQTASRVCARRSRRLDALCEATDAVYGEFFLFFSLAQISSNQMSHSLFLRSQGYYKIIEVFGAAADPVLLWQSA
jgi:hypothetical protein